MAPTLACAANWCEQLFGANSLCQVADATFVPQVGPNMGRAYLTGDEACAAAGWNPPTYRNPKFYVNYPNSGTGCEYELYDGSGTFLMRIFAQNQVLARQACPIKATPPDSLYDVTENHVAYSGHYELSDTSVSLTGRLWCAYCGPGDMRASRFGGSSGCATLLDQSRDKAKTCGVGNPIIPLTGTKRQSERLVPGWITATYDSTSQAPSIARPANGYPRMQFQRLSPMGTLWHSSFHRQLALQLVKGPNEVTAVGNVIADRGDGSIITFAKDGATSRLLPDVDVLDRLELLPAGALYFSAQQGLIELYESVDLRTMRLRAEVYASGRSRLYAYDAQGKLVSVSDERGRSVSLRYQDQILVELVDAAGSRVGLDYDSAQNLAFVRWPDGRQKEFKYESAAFRWALTGIVDEGGARFASYGYDSSGRSVSTEHAGGTERFSVVYQGDPPVLNLTETLNQSDMTVRRLHFWSDYPASPKALITQPNGAVIVTDSVGVAGMPHVSSRSQPAGSGCAPSTARLTYDGNGNVASADDFDGHRVCHAYDPDRNLESARIEGLANSVTCATVMGPNFALPAGSRRLGFQWHPDWRLEIKRAEPGRIVSSIYNGQPDPFSGNAVASCAPVSALLPDGKPIAVLCKRVEQATTDTDGHLGFAASLQAGVAPRVQAWTYNDIGQVLSATDALGNTSTYTYYADTAFSGADPWAVGHTRGDLKTATDALGHVTRYELYDKHGNPLQSIDPNGVVTRNTYDLRQRLLSTTVAGQTTAHSYDAAGQLLQVTAPDGSWVGYEYDPAHRLVAVKDNLGNRIDYTLDNAGNRLAERSKDAGGVLHQQLQRSIDALGRVQLLTGRSE